MHPAVALLYVASYSLGLLAIFVLALLRARDAEPMYGSELQIMCAFMCIIATLVLGEFLGDDFLDANPALVWALACSMAVGIGLMTHAVPRHAAQLNGNRLSRAVSLAFSVIALALALAQLLGNLIWGYDLQKYSFACMLAAMAWAVAYSFAMAVVKGKRAFDRDGFKVFFVMMVVSLVMMPLIAVSDFLGIKIDVQSGQRYYYFTPLYYAIWSVVLLRYRARALIDPGAVPAAAVKQASGGDEGRSLRAAYDISEREYEVLLLLVQGLSYARIADRLCISHSTVKTHVASIYRKTDSCGKLDVVNLMKEYI